MVGEAGGGDGSPGAVPAPTTKPTSASKSRAAGGRERRAPVVAAGPDRGAGARRCPTRTTDPARPVVRRPAGAATGAAAGRRPGRRRRPTLVAWWMDAEKSTKSPTSTGRRQLDRHAGARGRPRAGRRRRRPAGRPPGARPPTAGRPQARKRLRERSLEAPPAGTRPPAGARRGQGRQVDDVVAQGADARDGPVGQPGHPVRQVLHAEAGPVRRPRSLDAGAPALRRRAGRSQVAPRPGLLPLDGLEQGLEVARAEAPGAAPLDDLDEQRGPVGRPSR